jgi:hypothetical protein
MDQGLKCILQACVRSWWKGFDNVSELLDELDERLSSVDDDTIEELMDGEEDES